MKTTLVLKWALAACNLATASPSVRHHHHGVTYRGIYQSEVEAFLGISYAQDTGGEHRFKPPRPYVPEHGCTIEANNPGASCPQKLGPHLGPPFRLQNFTDTSEDCLRLNVYRPNGTHAGDKLPVMVYIHGGSFFDGSKDDPNILPPGLILQSIKNGHPVMNVNINYRLGVFGFAKSDALSREGSTNMGLRDQRLALEWVKANIGEFGGDCEKITIFGQSSGGLACGMQIMAYGGSVPAPFQQAICQSQALEPGITGKFTDKAMAKIIKALPCNTTDYQSERALECLRSLPFKDLVDAEVSTGGSDASANIGDEWLPIVDGDFLPAAPSTLIAEHRFNNITTMIGWCEDDTTPFVDTGIKTANETFTFFRDYLPGMTHAHVHELISLYPISEFTAHGQGNFSAEFFRAGRVLRDIIMTCQPIHYAAGIAAAGNRVYLYDQNQTILDTAFEPFNLSGLGVVHTAEFAYVFGNLSHYNDFNLPYHPTASDYALRDRESRTWSTFAALGHPSLKGHDTVQGWEPAFARKDQVDIFVIGGPHEGLSAQDGEKAFPEVERQRLRERCGFINREDIIKEIQY